MVLQLSQIEIIFVDKVGLGHFLKLIGFICIWLVNFRQIIRSFLLIYQVFSDRANQRFARF